MGQVQSGKQLSQTWLPRQEDRHKHPDLYPLITTGIPEMDRLLGGGFELGQYVIWGGAPKSGKTTAMLHMLQSVARQGRRFVWFGAEMNNMQIGSMLFSNISKVERHKIRQTSYQFELAEWTALQRAGQDLENFPGYFVDGLSTWDELSLQLDALESGGEPIDVIFVDYLQLFSLGNYQSRAQEVAALSRQMKLLTSGKRPRLACVASQYNRAAIKSGEIDATSFLDSGAIERDTDVAIGIDIVKDQLTGRPDPQLRDMRIILARELEPGKCRVRYIGKTATIEPDYLNEETLNHWS